MYYLSVIVVSRDNLDLKKTRGNKVLLLLATSRGRVHQANPTSVSDEIQRIDDARM